ncbi:MAG: hypothetical protein NVSMB9_17610 [Isosphaeraceae bacterium]
MKRVVLLGTLLVVSLTPVIFLVGCSNSNGLNLAKVRGKVMYKGAPVKNGTVFFMPDSTKQTVGPPGVGSITSDGSFVVSTDSAGDGAIVGAHKVGITGLEDSPVSSGPAPPTPESDPKAYMNAKAKGAAQARSGRAKSETETFTDRGGKVWRFVVPKKLVNPEESGIVAAVQSGSNTFNFEIDESGNVKINK